MAERLELGVLSRELGPCATRREEVRCPLVVALVPGSQLIAPGPDLSAIALCSQILK
jgi:hypothetical protein